MSLIGSARRIAGLGYATTHMSLVVDKLIMHAVTSLVLALMIELVCRLVDLLIALGHGLVDCTCVQS